MKNSPILAKTQMTNSSQIKVERFLKRLHLLTGNLGLDVPQIVKIEELRKLPPNTFGRAWADHLDKHQLAPFTTGPRRQQLHDGIHTLTGYDTDPIGEAEVQAFLVGATSKVSHKVFNLLLLIGLLRGIFQQISDHHSPIDVRERLWKAYHRSFVSTFNPDTWQPEHLWMLPLTEVQDLFGL